jgi:uncharacterized protein
MDEKLSGPLPQGAARVRGPLSDPLHEGEGRVRGELAIVGLDDPVTARADVRCIPDGAPGRFTVVLAHAPNVLELLNDRHAVDLVLCGHSHGGQCRLPRRRALFLPYGCRGRAEGHYRQNGHWMYVNRGLGWTFLPIRWNCPPEIVLLEWSHEAAASGVA